MQAFATDFETLRSVCLEQGFNETQCKVPEKVLGKGRDGLVTPVEEQELRDAGFSQAFVRELAGVDGAKALQARAGWLAEHAVDRWWRWDYYQEQQVAMLEEIGQMGVYANGVILLVFEALQEASSHGIQEAQIIEEAAVNTLSQLGPIDGSQVQTLLEEIEDHRTRSGAANGLIAVGRSDPSYIPAILDELEERDWIKIYSWEQRPFAPWDDLEGVKTLAAVDVTDPAKEQVRVYEEILKRVEINQDVRGFVEWLSTPTPIEPGYMYMQPGDWGM